MRLKATAPTVPCFRDSDPAQAVVVERRAQNVAAVVAGECESGQCEITFAGADERIRQPGIVRLSARSVVQEFERRRPRPASRIAGIAEQRQPFAGQDLPVGQRIIL